jgi:acetyl-CoA synthetase
MKPAVDEAVAQSPSVQHVIVYERLGGALSMERGRDITWDECRRDGELGCADTGAEDTLMIAYTSGTTGKPKGAVHVHGGFLVKMASETAYQTDLHPDETLYWVTDMGWIMGPWEMVGAGCAGAAVVLYEGAPDWPEPDRVWASVERHRVNVLGVSPTLIRALKTQGDEHVRKHDLSSLRIFGSTGEPWNPEPYKWLSEVAGDGRLPIINISGGTEVGACFITPYPVEEIKVCSLGGASHGMDIDVFDPDGRPVRGRVGELVCKRPWPGMTRGIWGDPERYLETYWSMYEGVWRHGDWALIDEQGDWFLLGRSDDTINVAGKRLGPAEVESVLVSHPAVSESAVVGVPHETKGEAIWCFCVLTDGGAGDGDEVEKALGELVAKELGRPFKPSRIVFVDALPKTRSAKILRRAVRAVAIGEDPGDMSSAENPQALDDIRVALGS